MATGSWAHNFPASKDAHPTYIDYDAPGWDTLIAAFFHEIFTALDAIQDALGYDITGGYADLETRLTTHLHPTIAETEVFNGLSPNPSAFTNLDLSGTVGSNYALVLLKFSSGTAGQVVTFRKDGDTDSYWDTVNDPYGCSACLTSNVHTVFLVATSSVGVIEWQLTAVDQACTIDIIAFIT